MATRSSALALLAAPLLLLPSISEAAVSSAELYTTAHYQYGRFSAKIRFAGNDGVISSFFLWKEGSHLKEVYWNELDFEKVGLDNTGACKLELNAINGMPGPVNHTSHTTLTEDICGGFHEYAYEWTPTSLAWFMDGVELRRETGELALTYADNAPDGMQFRFNVWPGDASFGGTFTETALPVTQEIEWVKYEPYDAGNGTFGAGWTEEFDSATAPTGWTTGNWGSPKNLSTHVPTNVTFVDGKAVLALTTDLPTTGAGTGGAGSTGTGGTPTTPGQGTGTGTTPTPVANSDDGCSVAAVYPQRAAHWAATLGLVGLALWLRRRH